MSHNACDAFCFVEIGLGLNPSVSECGAPVFEYTGVGALMLSFVLYRENPLTRFLRVFGTSSRRGFGGVGDFL